MTDPNGSIYPELISTGLLLPIPQGPYVANGVTMSSFLVHADHDKLQGHLDHYINDRDPDGEWEYKALIPNVLITYAHLMGDVFQEDGKKVGLMDENDLCFWVLCVAMRKTALGIRIPSHLTWFVPFIFVDNPFAVVAGREIYGFPKTVGRFLDADGVDIRRHQDHQIDVRNPTYRVDVLAFDKSQPDQLGTEQTLLSCEPLDEPSGHPGDTWTDPKQAVEGFVPHLTGHEQGMVHPSFLDEALDALLHLLKPDMNLLFLKQHRAAASIKRAGYQAIVEEPISLTGFHGMGLYTHKYRLTLNPLWHYPIAEMLGIQNENGVLTPSVGSWSIVDFSNADANVRWQWPPLPDGETPPEHRSGCMPLSGLFKK
ncbi:MAG: acetoacetate decarboxylase family protein [Gemmatimonadota bacterium]|nr:acetoacetate decarboxylase family protein [Gemmatimonadota bacterium]